MILNLYPKGTLEYDEKGIKSTGTSNKAVLKYEEIKHIEYNEPTLLKNGNITFETITDVKVRCIFRKKRKDDAIIVYQEILNFKQKHPTLPKPVLEEHKEKYENKTNNVTSAPEATQGSSLTSVSESTHNINTFEFLIREGRPGFFVDERNVDLQKATVTLTENSLLINKSSYWRNKNRGNKEILYSNITSVDLDFASTFGVTNYIEITLSGSNLIILQNTNKEITETFYNRLQSRVKQQSIEDNTKTIINNNVNAAEELLKWHELLEKGIISQEEFDAKKRELL